MLHFKYVLDHDYVVESHDEKSPVVQDSCMITWLSCMLVEQPCGGVAMLVAERFCCWNRVTSVVVAIYCISE